MLCSNVRCCKKELQDYYVVFLTSLPLPVLLMLVDMCRRVVTWQNRWHWPLRDSTESFNLDFVVKAFYTLFENKETNYSLGHAGVIENTDGKDLNKNMS